jgi:hypothetical protein
MTEYSNHLEDDLLHASHLVLLFSKLDSHLIKNLDGKNRRLSLSANEVSFFRDVICAVQRVMDAVEDGWGGPSPDGGHVLEGVGRIEDNVIYPDVWHRLAA